jgi:type I restriction enzyme S subunit
MEKLPRSRVYGGEMLMVFVGAGLGNVGIVPKKEEYFLGPNVA